MAGILDSKKRIMDTIITQEGKRQLAAGQFQIKYASFTDTYDYYEGDNIDGCTDATQRIHLEASHAANDSIVIESDDSGKLISYDSGAIVLDNDGSVIVHGLEADDVLDPSIETGGSVLADVEFNEDGNPVFSSLASVALDTTFGAFDSQNIIRTSAYSETETPFSIERIGGDAELRVRGTPALTGIDSYPPICFDKAFKKIDNFKFLPPVNKNDGSDNGVYATQNYASDLGFGYGEVLESVYQDGTFSEVIKTQLLNKNIEDSIMIQVFEVDENNKKIKKLDIIDLGTSNTYHPETDASYDSRGIIVGKVSLDINGDPVFIKMFAIELTNEKDVSNFNIFNPFFWTESSHSFSVADIPTSFSVADIPTT